MYLCAPLIVVAGTVYGPDLHPIPLTTALWTYSGVRHGIKKLSRVDS